MKTAINKFRGKCLNVLTSSVKDSCKLEDIAKIQTLDVKRVLIVRPNSRLGNQLMVTPLLQEIIKDFPNCKIDIIVRGGLTPILLKNYENIDNIIMLPSKPFKQLVKYMKVWLSVRKYNYDLAINIVEGSSSGRLLTKISKSKTKIFNQVIPELAEQYPDYVHMAKNAVYNLRAILQREGTAFDATAIPALSLRLNEVELARGKKVLYDIFKNDKPTLCFYTFATADKCYSKEWWKEVYHNLKDRYGEHYNLLEVLPKENVSQIDFQCTSYYSTDIREMCATLANADIFITADCGVMHLASSSEVPTIGIFSRDNTQYYEPYNTHSVGVYSEKTDIPTLLKIIDETLTKKADERQLLTNILQAQIRASENATKQSESDLNDLI